MPGASWLHVSQSMHVESTKKSPGTFSGKRCCRLAMLRSYFKFSHAKAQRRKEAGQVEAKEQVRKRGLPPPLLGLDERGQAPLPDLFFYEILILQIVFVN